MTRGTWFAATGAALILGWAGTALAEDKPVSITGKVVFDEKAPKPKPKAVPTPTDAHCAKLHEKEPLVDETFVLGEKGEMKNVFVQVTGGPLKGKTFDPPAQPAVLDQKGCIYRPHVIGIQVGQTLRITNSDDTNHNIHSLSTKNKEFNLAQPRKGKVDEVKMTKEEIFRIKCDVHQWMGAWAYVVPTPFFAVTDEKGEFSIRGLEPGEYDVDFYHEGPVKFFTTKVKVEAGKATTIPDVKFTPKKPGPTLRPKPAGQ